MNTKTFISKAVLTAVVLTMGLMTSCSNDSEESAAEKGDRMLTLSITTKSVTRGTVLEADPGATEDVITRLAIGIFNDDGNAVKIQEFTSDTWTEPSAGNIQVVVSAQYLVNGNRVMAIANAPTTANFATCSTLDEFKARAISIKDALANSTADKEKTIGFAMIGNSRISAVGSGNVNFTASITLYHLVAKVSLLPITLDFSQNKLYPNAQFSVSDIYLYNVPSSKTFWYISDTGASAYYSGNSDDASFAEYLGNNGAALDMTKTHYLYTLPNGETGNNATKLVIKGTFKPTPTSVGSTSYYPIYLDYIAPTIAGGSGTAATGDLPDYAGEISLTARTPKVVYANDNYKINVTIKSVGAPSAEQDLDPQAVQVTVAVAPWTDLNQSATFE